MSLDKEEVNGSVGECEGPLETGDVEMEGYEETEALMNEMIMERIRQGRILRIRAIATSNAMVARYCQRWQTFGWFSNYPSPNSYGVTFVVLQPDRIPIDTLKLSRKIRIVVSWG
jgi:hypothetical protein